MIENKIYKIPYSHGNMEITLENKRVKAVIHPETYKSDTIVSETALVAEALNNPTNSIKLREMAKEAKKVLVITSDHTRPVPSSITLPVLLKEIRSNNPSAEIKILIATGFHRSTTNEEMLNKFGWELVEKEEFINHNCSDNDKLVFKGILPSGGELWLNSLVDWADLVVSEGFIEPHFFAGFSGGRKSILPGIAARKTVFANHCSKFIASDYARTGNLENNPIHKDMLFAAKQAKLRFILNVVIDSEKKIIKAFAGDPEEAHKEGCQFVSRLSKVSAVKADIVITSNGGYPLDQNIYQAVKGMTAAEACVKEDGVIIIAAACNDGHGGDEFYRWFANASSPKEVADKIAAIPQSKTIADQWQAQILARVLMKSTVILVTDICESELINALHMQHAVSMEEALEMAEDIVGKDSDIVVIPDGVAVIID